MRLPSRRRVPGGQNHQAAPPWPSGGGVRGPGDPSLSPPPPQPMGGRWPARGTAAPHPPGGAAAPGGGETAAAASAAARQAPPVDRPHTPALPAADRQENSGTQEGANEATHSEAGLGKAGKRTRARRSLPPPPRHTDLPAADRTAPGAHGRPATPTARACPRGARRRPRMTGTGATGHPKGQGGGEQRRGSPSPPCSPSSPAGLRAARAPALRPPPGPRGHPPFPRRDRGPQGRTQLDPHAARPRAPHRLLPRGPRPAGEPAPARQNDAPATPGGGTRRRTGTVWGPRPP